MDQESLMHRACFLKEVPRHPVWFMGQAGRHLKNYSSIRNGRSIIELQTDYLSSARISTEAVLETGSDAAVIYADITIPIIRSGFPLHIDEQIGPISDRVVSSHEDISELKHFDPAKDTDFIIKEIKAIKEAMPDVPVIGFAGGPFTTLSYLLEGKPSRSFDKSIAIMDSSKRDFKSMMEIVADLTIKYLKAQISAGAEVIQLFDSWSGLLGHTMYHEHIKKHVQNIFSSIPSSIPKIYFSVNSRECISEFTDIGCNALSIDSSLSTKEAESLTSHKFCIQGNLAPKLLFDGGSAMERASLEILRDMESSNAFIFNLAGRVLPDTKPSNMLEVSTLVKRTKRHF